MQRLTSSRAPSYLRLGTQQEEEKRWRLGPYRLSVAFELLHLLWAKPHCLLQYLHTLADQKVSVSATLLWLDGLRSLALTDDFI